MRWLLPWVLTGIGALLVAALVWFLGPLWSPLEGWPIRAAIIAVIVLAWAGGNWWAWRRRRQADAALAAGVAAPAPAGSDEEAAAVAAKLVAALATLRKARGTRGYLYEQPWYVIIGPPGAGKTTALVNSGLSFPLAAESGQSASGQAAIAGVGGTRLCDWWFTDEAVLIDTAGRYTTQDSDARVDRAGWEAFLDLLRRTRAQQPLNGVLVAISVAHILTNPAEARSHAQAIRTRVKELTDRLGVRLPVYALLTKADLIAGFTEFFDDLDRERREQVWGTTFLLVATEAGAVTGFRKELAALVGRLGDRVLARLQAERSPDRRVLIAGFPAQVASLEEPLAAFLGAAFGGSRLDPAPLLRGVYLASGTQQGTPIDRLTSVLAQAFGVDQRLAPSLGASQGRSYFLGRLLKQVVFGEAMLVSEPPGRARRRLLLRASAFAAVLLTGSVGFALWTSGSTTQADTARFNGALAEYERSAGTLRLDPVAEGDLSRAAPLLDQAAALPFADAGANWGIGLSQAGKLGAAARTVYRHALDHMLLPRLVWQLEAQMRGNLNRPDFLYEATRVWDALLADLAVVPLRNLQRGVQDLYVLASPQSPMRDLLSAIARQLSLSEPPPATPGAGPAAGATPDTASIAAASAAARLQAVVGLTPASMQPVQPPGQVIDDRYKALRDFVGHGPGAPIDITLKLLNDLQQQLSTLANAAAGGTAPAVAAGPDPGQLLRAEAYRQPAPVSGWLQTVAATGDRLRGGGAKQQATAAFNGANGPAQLCKKAMEGRYPFKARAQPEIPLDDFARLFAPGGMLDAFFNQQLRAFVDQSAIGWKLQAVGGVEPPIAEAQLLQFQRAALIRDLFFGAGGATPTVRFDITPVSADPGTKQVTLDFNGIAVTYIQGPPRSTQVTWPGAQGMATVRLVFDPPPSSGPAVMQFTGPWALFRLFGQGTLTQQGGAEEYLLSFHMGERTAAFQIRAGSVNNPFSPGVLQTFQCPQLL